MKFLGTLLKKFKIPIWECAYHLTMYMIISSQFLSQKVLSLLSNALGKKTTTERSVVTNTDLILISRILLQLAVLKYHAIISNSIKTLGRRVK